MERTLEQNELSSSASHGRRFGEPQGPDVVGQATKAAPGISTPRVPLLRWTLGFVNRIVRTVDLVVLVVSSVLLLLFACPALAPLTLMQAVWVGVLEATVFVQLLRRFGAYRVEQYMRRWMSVGAVACGLGIAWIVDGIYLSAFHPRGVVSTFLSLAAVHLPQLALLIVARQGARLLWIGVRERGLVRRNVALIGTNPSGEAVLRRMLSPAERGNFNVVGVFADQSDERQEGTLLGRPIMGDMAMLGAYAESHVVDVVVVALPLPRAAQTVAMIEALQWMATDVVIPFEEIGFQPSFARLASVAGVPTLQVLHRPLKGSEALLKIIEDYVVASVALFILSPLMIAVAIAIRLDSKGPVFFRQPRTGFNNNVFHIYKFRTMLVDPTDDGSVGTTSRHDPRITRVGGILRRLSIDELPQLLNVLRGEMSVVGPRPYVPNMLVGGDQFRAVVQNYAFRFRLKPGITGLAQASGLRSNALRTLANAQRSIELDLAYISHWSIWLDFRIMVQTVLVSMTGKEVF